MRVVWSGAGVVGPGLSTFYFDDGFSDPTDVRAFFFALASLIPDDVQITVPASGDVINPASGVITGTWTGTPVAVVNGASASTFAIGVGSRIVWETDGIRNGRHVRGSTFLVPLTTALFDTAGRITATHQGTIQAAAAGLLSSSANHMKIWSRPEGFPNGQVSTVTSVRVSENPSTLRTRRT